MSFFANLLLSLVAFSMPFSSNPEKFCSPFSLAPKKANPNSSTVEGFNLIASYFHEGKFLNCEDGYTSFAIDYYKMEYTTHSSLFIIHANSSFTPGYAARKNNHPEYKEYSLKRGYVHLEVKRAQRSDGSHGGSIYPKWLWPTSTSITTISSSTSSQSLAYNYGTNASVSLGLDGVVANVGSSRSTSLTFQVSNTVSSQFSDPVVSSQFSPNGKVAEWNFEVINREPAGNITFTFDQYYMFELDDDYYGINQDAFDLSYSVRYQGQYTGFMWLTYDGWEFDKSINFACFY